jgi:hypothetical protein
MVAVFVVKVCWILKWWTFTTSGFHCRRSTTAAPGSKCIVKGSRGRPTGKQKPFEKPSGPNPGNGQFAAAGLARQYARLHIKTLVFVHVFSGFRRQGDLHQLLEHQVWNETHFFVISIDMCLQKIEGNLASTKAFQFWMRQIETGKVCGMAGGPPCETYTAARLLEGGPPPLLAKPRLQRRSWLHNRNGLDSWNLLGCSPKMGWLGLQKPLDWLTDSWVGFF